MLHLLIMFPKEMRW